MKAIGIPTACRTGLYAITIWSFDQMLHCRIDTVGVMIRRRLEQQCHETFPLPAYTVVTDHRYLKPALKEARLGALYLASTCHCASKLAHHNNNSSKTKKKLLLIMVLQHNQTYASAFTGMVDVLVLVQLSSVAHDNQA